MSIQNNSHDVAVPPHHKREVKEHKKLNKYLDILRGTKKKKKENIVSIIISELETILKNIVQRLKELVNPGKNWIYPAYAFQRFSASLSQNFAYDIFFSFFGFVF